MGTNNIQATVISVERPPTSMLKKGKTSLLKHTEAWIDASLRHDVPSFNPVTACPFHNFQTYTAHHFMHWLVLIPKEKLAYGNI
jgi:hypothetical protein